MIISSSILALDARRNSGFDEFINANSRIICIVDEPTKATHICEINQSLTSKNLGKILPIYQNEKELVFSVTLEDLDKGLRIIKRLLWEFGVLLSTKIVLVTPEIELLKDYGENE